MTYTGKEVRVLNICAPLIAKNSVFLNRRVIDELDIVNTFSLISHLNINSTGLVLAMTAIVCTIIAFPIVFLLLGIFLTPFIISFYYWNFLFYCFH